MYDRAHVSLRQLAAIRVGADGGGEGVNPTRLCKICGEAGKTARCCGGGRQRGRRPPFAWIAYTVRVAKWGVSLENRKRQSAVFCVIFPRGQEPADRTRALTLPGGLTEPSSPLRHAPSQRWNCDIALDQSLLTRPRRYPTGRHELLHSVSVGLNPNDYPRFAGFEEGVVEQCTRLLQNEIFAALGLQGPFDTRNSYPNEIAALETLRTRANKVKRDCYLGLLSTPLRNREAVVLQWIQEAEPMTSAAQIDRETADFRRILKS